MKASSLMKKFIWKQSLICYIFFFLIDKRITKSHVALALQSTFVMLAAKGNMLVVNTDVT